MCGIFGLLNNKTTFDMKYINVAFDKGNNRGPEESKISDYNEKLLLGFKRLAINGLSPSSGQPMTIDGITLICNGEIYNYKELYNVMGVTPTTGSDCEVIIRMYQKHGFEYTVGMLDGVFALMIHDASNLNYDPVIYIARDPFGVRPLYALEIDENIHCDKESEKFNYNLTTERIVSFASEMKMLTPLLGNSNQLKWIENVISLVPKSLSSQGIQKRFSIKPFTPGTFSVYSKKAFIVNSYWEPKVKNKCFFKVSSPKTIKLCDEQHALRTTFEYLDDAVRKRVVGTTERPVACLLSGGLDSSIVASIVNKYYKSEHPLKTFTIGMSGSEDVKHARIVAKHLGTDHTEIILTPDEMFKAIPEVIQIIESYDTTTVRASVGNYLVCKHISQYTDAKVIFNGDGSDEVTGGYLYFLKAPDNLSFDKECRRLLSDIHMFDVLRSDRCISSNGLEPRTPFLDKSFVDYYLSLPIEMRNPNSTGVKCEKHFIRKAISENAPTLLPSNIVWRTKEAFSDGVSGNKTCWFQVIQNKVASMKLDTSTSWKHNIPQTLEQKYYRTIYDSLYPGTAQIVPYFWMPKFVNAQDCSARTLEIYSQRFEEKKEKKN